MATLDGMVGLASVKREVSNMVNLLATARRRNDAGLPVPSLSRHLIFAGPMEDHRDDVVVIAAGYV